MGPVLNLGHQILSPVPGHLPCPSSLFLAPSSCGRSKNRLSPLVFQAEMNKKPQSQRSEAEKSKETTPQKSIQTNTELGSSSSLVPLCP